MKKNGLGSDLIIFLVPVITPQQQQDDIITSPSYKEEADYGKKLLQKTKSEDVERAYRPALVLLVIHKDTGFANIVTASSTLEFVYHSPQSVILFSDLYCFFYFSKRILVCNNCGEVNRFF